MNKKFKNKFKNLCKLIIKDLKARFDPFVIDEN